MNFKKATSPADGSPESRHGGHPQSLNVFFNFNGHSFDAYEVLGVPAGSTMEEIQNIYHKNRQLADPSSHEFFRAAFDAISEHKGRNRS